MIHPRQSRSSSSSAPPPPPPPIAAVSDRFPPFRPTQDPAYLPLTVCMSICATTDCFEARNFGASWKRTRKDPRSQRERERGRLVGCEVVVVVFFWLLRKLSYSRLVELVLVHCCCCFCFFEMCDGKGREKGKRVYFIVVCFVCLFVVSRIEVGKVGLASLLSIYVRHEEKQE